MSNCRNELIHRAIRHARSLGTQSGTLLADAECLGVTPLRPTLWCLEFVDRNGSTWEFHVNPMDLPAEDTR